MTDRTLDALLVIAALAFGIGGTGLLVREAFRPAEPCADYAAMPGVACARGSALVVEGGVALCRCPEARR